VRYSHARPSIE